MKHANVAVFVPHLGCPNQCIFCNQRSISGQAAPVSVENVRGILSGAVSQLAGKKAEIAFFGGSFTAIPFDDMIAYLEASAPYLHAFSGIRISTRPDCISNRILKTLKSYGVTMIELGVQSMDDTVLRRNKRGHTSAQVYQAFSDIRNAGFYTGLQMMTGMYGDTKTGALRTAKKLISLHPDCVRIYPTLVLKGTELETYYLNGSYRPMELEETVTLAAELLLLFHNSEIPVIRLGLHAEETLEGSMIAGAYHPALRELAENRIYYKEAQRVLTENSFGSKHVRLAVMRGCLSKMIGQKRKNISLLEAETGKRIQVKEDAQVKKYQVIPM